VGLRVGVADGLPQPAGGEGCTGPDDVFSLVSRDAGWIGWRCRLAALPMAFHGPWSVAARAPLPALRRGTPACPRATIEGLGPHSNAAARVSTGTWVAIEGSYSHVHQGRVAQSLERRRAATGRRGAGARARARGSVLGAFGQHQLTTLEPDTPRLKSRTCTSEKCSSVAPRRSPRPLPGRHGGPGSRRCGCTSGAVASEAAAAERAGPAVHTTSRTDRQPGGRPQACRSIERELT